MVTVGVERERFIACNTTGRIVPSIGTLLPVVHKVAGQDGMAEERFTYELFAGQVEDKSPPCSSLEELVNELGRNECVLVEAANQLGVGYDHSEFVQAHQIGVLAVNPFSCRHQTIWESLPASTRLAASAVAAVHIHVAVNEAVAVRTLNRCRAEVVESLIAQGDHSQGKRIASYRQMAGSLGIPPCFESFAEVLAYIEGKGGEKNVWDLVRYKPSTQTIEFRMFGATPSIPEILDYVQVCLEVVG